MNRTVAAVCAAILVVILSSEKCNSLEYNIETSDNVKNSQSDESVTEAEIPDSADIEFKHGWKFHPAFSKYFQNVEHKEEDTLDEVNETFKRRVVRQAYQGQTQIYPNLPSGSPYGLEPYPNNNHNNQNPSHNQQWPQPNSSSQSGYPSQINGYQPAYRPNNYTSNPSGPHGQNYQPNPSQPNGYQPYNNPYGTNTQTSHGNNSLTNYNSYKPSNSTNPQGTYGQNLPPWQPQNQPNSGQRPYNSSNAQNHYPGYKPVTISSRSPYSQPGQSQNNSYAGYPSQTPEYVPYNPNQKPQYYPGQSQQNNTQYSQGVPGNQHPVIYDSTTKRPGQTPYGSYNVNSWSANNLNNTQGRVPYNSQPGQNPQNFNSYPGSQGYGPQNSTNPYNAPNQRPPYQNQQTGQNPSNSYPGYGPATYNTNIPNKPTYGNASPYSNGPYGNVSPNYYPNGTLYDPTKVSPGHFNSY